jgi:hypothetical protein
MLVLPLISLFLRNLERYLEQLDAKTRHICAEAGRHPQSLLISEPKFRAGIGNL